MVLTRRKSLVRDAKAIPTISLDSDHQAVVVKVSITIPPATRKPKTCRIAVENLGRDTQNYPSVTRSRTL